MLMAKDLSCSEYVKKGFMRHSVNNDLYVEERDHES